MREKLSKYWTSVQSYLIPELKEEVGPIGEKHQQVVRILELIRIEEFVAHKRDGLVGRPPEERKAIARAFVAKAVLNLATTRMLLDRLEFDIPLRRICGWERRNDIPSESTFSRAFAEFAESELCGRVHEVLIERAYEEQIVGHVSRDATEIEAREKPKGKAPKKKAKKHKRGRPRKGEQRPKPERRLEKQQRMTLPEMLDELPKDCDVGTKRNSKGFQESWTGYKLHLDVGDGDVPLSAILTSASVHDSQVAIPLATLTNSRVLSLYDLMDAAYDAPEIREHSASLGHVPIIDINPRRNTELKEELRQEQHRRKLLNLQFPEQRRYNQRSSAERVNARLKDDFGARYVRVRGNLKVACHLMFGVLALTAEQLWRFVQ